MKSLIPWRKRRTESAKGGKLIPFGDFSFSLSRMRDEFDRLFDRMAREFSALAERGGEGWRWGLDVEEQDDSIVVRAEAPGFEAGDFDVRVEDGRLVLSASKKVETKGEKGNVKEFREQACYESVALPAGIDKDKVEASYRSGVLTVRHCDKITYPITLQRLERVTPSNWVQSCSSSHRDIYACWC